MRRFSAIVALMFFSCFMFLDGVVLCAFIPLPTMKCIPIEECPEIQCEGITLDCIVKVSCCGYTCENPIILILDLDPDYKQAMIDNKDCLNCEFTSPSLQPIIIEYRILQFESNNVYAMPNQNKAGNYQDNANKKIFTKQSIHQSIASMVLRC